MRQDQFDLIRQWATERGLYENGDITTQFIKLAEEQGEFARAFLHEDVPGQIDAIGDMVIVLTNLAGIINLANFHPLMDDLTIEKCIESAWSVIKDRKGSMKNGTFVKE